jgi:hypothetical protein
LTYRAKRKKRKEKKERMKERKKKKEADCDNLSQVTIQRKYSKLISLQKQLQGFKVELPLSTFKSWVAITYLHL